MAEKSKMKAKTIRSLYSVHPAVAMVQKAIAGLKEKTGRDLEEWMAFIREEGPPTEKERRAWLKEVHGLGTNYSWWLAEWTDGKNTEDGDPDAYLQAAARYVEAMYAGPKTVLKPIHDRVLELAFALGDDVKVCPCQTIVPLYRNHVFAEIKPATKKRIDLGFALKNAPASGRLIDTGGFAKKNRITHRIPLESVAEIDDEVNRWLKAAYELDK